MKKYLSFVLALMMLLSITTMVPAEQKELEGEVTFWHSFTQGARMEAIQEAAAKFMELNPKVTIKMETYSWGDFNTKWNAGLMTGDLPDISTAQGTGEVVEMVNAGVISPVGDLVDTIGRDRFSERALNDMTRDGNNYGVPYYSHAQVMWYRQDLLEANNLEVPTTWKEFYDAAIALTKDGVYGAAVSMSPNDLLGTRYLNFYVRSGGGSLLNDDLSPNLTSDLAIEGIKFWLDVYKNCSPAETINYTVLDHATLYYQGLTAFDFNSGFMVSGVQNNRPDLVQYVKCALLPKMSEGDADYGAETSHIPLVLWNKAKVPEAAKAFLAFLYQEDNYVRFLDAVPVGMLPALKDITTNEKFLANPTVEQFEEEIAIISEAITLGSAIGFEHGPSVQASYLTSQGIVEEMFQDIITNGTEVEVAAQRAQDKLTEIFDTMIN